MLRRSLGFRAAFLCLRQGQVSAAVCLVMMNNSGSFMLKDIRFALRQLLKQPAFTAIAVVTIALAIGATTAVLSLVNGLLVRPLPYREPQQLILLLQHFKSQNLERIPVSPPEFKDYETRAHSFEKLGAFGYTNFNLANEDRPERIAGATVTAGVLPLLGVSPIKGRFFQPEECTLGRDDVVIISARLWQRRFNSDPQIIGTKLLLNGKNFTVVGVMPRRFRFSTPAFQSRQWRSVWRARRNLEATRVHR